MADNNNFNLDFSKMDFSGDAFQKAFAEGYGKTTAGSANPMGGFTGTGLVGGPESAGGTNAAANTTGPAPGAPSGSEPNYSSIVPQTGAQGTAPIMRQVARPSGVTMREVSQGTAPTMRQVTQDAMPTEDQVSYNAPQYNAVDPNQPLSSHQQEAVRGASAQRDAYDSYVRNAMGASPEETIKRASAAAAQDAQGVSDQAVQQAIKAARSSGAMGGQGALAATGQAAGSYGSALQAGKQQYFDTARLGGELGAAMQARLQNAATDATQRYGVDVGANTSRYGTDVGAATSRYGTEKGAAMDKYRALLSSRDQKYGTDVSAAQSQYNTDVGSRDQRYNTDVGAAQSQYNTDVASQNQLYNTDVGAADSQYRTEVGSRDQRYSTDVGANEQRYSTDVGKKISEMQDRTQRRGQDLGLVPGIVGAVGGVAQVAASDKNLKEDIRPKSFANGLDKLKSFSYKYKKGVAYEGGRQEGGIMAQDLERTAMKPAVIDTPDGKMIDTRKLTSMNTGALSEHESRLKKIEDMVKYLGTMKKPEVKK